MPDSSWAVSDMAGSLGSTLLSPSGGHQHRGHIRNTGHPKRSAATKSETQPAYRGAAAILGFRVGPAVSGAKTVPEFFSGQKRGGVGHSRKESRGTAEEQEVISRVAKQFSTEGLTSADERISTASTSVSARPSFHDSDRDQVTSDLDRSTWDSRSDPVESEIIIPRDLLESRGGAESEMIRRPG